MSHLHSVSIQFCRRWFNVDSFFQQASYAAVIFIVLLSSSNETHRPFIFCFDYFCVTFLFCHFLSTYRPSYSHSFQTQLRYKHQIRRVSHSKHSALSSIVLIAFQKTQLLFLLSSSYIANILISSSIKFD